MRVLYFLIVVGLWWSAGKLNSANSPTCDSPPGIFFIIHDSDLLMIEPCLQWTQNLPVLYAVIYLGQ